MTLLEDIAARLATSIARLGLRRDQIAKHQRIFSTSSSATAVRFDTMV
jgi:hypothetical protein